MIAFYRPQLSLFTLTGEKTAAFLHGQLTNHIKGLKDGEINQNLLLTIKGKILAPCHVARSGDAYQIICETAVSEKLMGHLKKLAPLSRVTIECQEGLSSLHVLTENTPSKGLFIFKTDRLGLAGYDIFYRDEFPLESHAHELSEEEENILRVEHGIAKRGVDFTEDHFPQEVRLEKAINFEKGCYLGQEIIARLHYRGHVNKLLAVLKLEIPFPPNTSLWLENKKVGQLTTSVFSQHLKAPLALGFIPYNHSDEGAHFTLENPAGPQAIVVPLPLKK